MDDLEIQDQKNNLTEVGWILHSARMALERRNGKLARERLRVAVEATEGIILRIDDEEKV